MAPTELDKQDREFLHRLIDRAKYLEELSVVFEQSPEEMDTWDGIEGVKRFLERRTDGHFTQEANIRRRPTSQGWMEADYDGLFRWAYHLGYPVFKNE